MKTIFKKLISRGNISKFCSKNKNQPTLIILRALALGDLLTAIPALRALKKAFPSHRRILTCPRWLVPLAELTDAADEFIEGANFIGEDKGQNDVKYRIPTDIQKRIKLEKAQLNGLIGLSEKPDIAVNLRGVRIATHKVLLDLKPSKFIGFYNEDVSDTRGSAIWQPDEHEVVRWCRLLQENGIPADPCDLHFIPPKCNVPAFVKGATIIHPGAGSPARHWPIERWAAIAQLEKERGNRVILTGGPHEVDIASKIAAISDLHSDAIFAGRTDILKLTAFCSAAKRIICTDTGIAHLAVALRIPSVTLFGPMPPSRWGPPGHIPRHRVLWARMIGEPYALNPDKGLLKISVKDVVSEIIDLEEKGYY